MTSVFIKRKNSGIEETQKEDHVKRHRESELPTNQGETGGVDPPLPFQLHRH